MNSLWCPLAFRNITVENDGNVSKYATCCRGKFAVDDDNQEITSDTHTPSQAFNAPYFKDIRISLLRNEQHPNCESCWTLEREGVESMRQTELKKLHFSNLFSSQEKLEIIDVSFGNLCNLKCRTCGPVDSTRWIGESYDIDSPKSMKISDYYKLNTKKTDIDSEFFQDLIKICSDGIKGINFYGGEPLIMPQTWKLLESIKDKPAAKNMFLYLNTNITNWDIEKIKVFDNFQFTTIGLSLDGLGDRFEYLRHPAKWQHVLKNIQNIISWKKASPDTREIYLIHTVSAYNIWYIPEVLEFAESLDLNLYINGCFFEQDKFAIQHIPSSLRPIIDSHLKSKIEKESRYWSEVSKILDFHDSAADYTIWDQWLADVKVRDGYRGEDFLKTFSEYWNIINE
jgi:MoaA/NifB/PqqE/SkfB family radical SAM enzyme